MDIIDYVLDSLLLEEINPSKSRIHEYVVTYHINDEDLVLYFSTEGNVKDAMIGGHGWSFHLSECFNRKHVQPTLRSSTFTSNTRFVKFSKVIKKFKNLYDKGDIVVTA